MAVVLCAFIIPSMASATEFVLSTSSIEQSGNGIRYTGTDELVIEIQNDATIRSAGNAGIESTAPVTIRSPAGRTLTIIVDNDSVFLYGITAPSVSLESGHVNITVRGENDAERGNAFGISAGSGNVTISGGSVSADVATAGHKNKGIYASRYVVVTDGVVDVRQRGGSNTFGLDGGDVETNATDGGVLISGGTIVVRSEMGTTRNFGIDSKFGTVGISGDPVIIIFEDGSGARQNWAYNPNVTAISGGKAVVFASEGGNYTLREDAVLARNAMLIDGSTFEIPVSRTLGIAERTYLTRPADTTLLSGAGYGTFAYVRSTSDKNGDEVYAGEETTQMAPAPAAGQLAGLGTAVLLRRRKEPPGYCRKD